MDREFPIDPELEQGYNVSLSRDGFQDLIGAWARRSEAFRRRAIDSYDSCHALE
jgi:hypothetical protein